MQDRRDRTQRESTTTDANAQRHAVQSRDVGSPSQPDVGGSWNFADAINAGLAIQLDGAATELDANEVHAQAAYGFSGARGSLPFEDTIQRAFGNHDVSGIASYVGGPASDAAHAIGASAYASGNQVAFAGPPDLHTAAHEAAHIVQQRHGVRLSDNIGRTGDRYEQHADAVADLVVAGESAESLLDQHGDLGSPGGGAVQRTPPHGGESEPALRPMESATSGPLNERYEQAASAAREGRWALARDRFLDMMMDPGFSAQTPENQHAVRYNADVCSRRAGGAHHAAGARGGGESSEPALRPMESATSGPLSERYEQAASAAREGRWALARDRFLDMMMDPEFRTLTPENQHAVRYNADVCGRRAGGAHGAAGQRAAT